MEKQGSCGFFSGAARYNSHVESYGDDKRAHDMPTNGQNGYPEATQGTKQDSAAPLWSYTR
jgi:hypothetical protein